MSVDAFGRSIFITNTFANAHPEIHVELWNRFIQDVPKKERSGVYGADNLAYVKWLNTQNNPLVQEFLQTYTIQESL